MPAIQLTSPAYSNGNRFLDAGLIVEIGAEKHQITEERAVDIVLGNRAVEVSDEALAELEPQPEPQSAETPARRGRAKAPAAPNPADNSASGSTPDSTETPAGGTVPADGADA